MKKAFLITATDTGVGKTFIGLCLLKAFKKMGIKVFPVKPVETGCLELPQDAEILRKEAGIADLEEVCPYRFREPLAPAVAEKVEGKSIDLELIARRIEEAKNKADLVMVEGAGGLLVPIKNRFTYADLANLLDLPLLVVARSKLGTINHTLLTLRVAKAQGLSILAVVLNQFEGKDIAEKTNPEVIKKLSGEKVFTVKTMKEPSPITEIAEFIYENLKRK